MSFTFVQVALVLQLGAGSVVQASPPATACLTLVLREDGYLIAGRGVRIGPRTGMGSLAQDLDDLHSVQHAADLAIVAGGPLSEQLVLVVAAVADRTGFHSVRRLSTQRFIEPVRRRAYDEVFQAAENECVGPSTPVGSPRELYQAYKRLTFRCPNHQPSESPAGSSPLPTMEDLSAIMKGCAAAGAGTQDFALGFLVDGCAESPRCAGDCTTPLQEWKRAWFTEVEPERARALVRCSGEAVPTSAIEDPRAYRGKEQEVIRRWLERRISQTIARLRSVPALLLAGAYVAEVCRPFLCSGGAPGRERAP